ncbi:MAG: acyltransferase [Bacteroides sp.]|nr:acyltransferase [Bacteroides sp.]
MNTAAPVRGGSRLSSLDSCKAVAAICVVLIHFGFPGLFGSSLQAICRWAVPYFFMVSGYFAYSENWDFKRITKKSLRIFKMTLVAVAIYLVYNIVTDGIASVFSELSILNILKLVVFNAPQVSSAHLWFLFALIYCYLLLIVTHKLLNTWLLKLYIVVALVLHVMIAEVLPAIGIVTFAHPIVRNAYLLGFPFFLTGYYVRANEKFIEKIKKPLLVAVAIIGATLAVLEHTFIVSSDLLELYVGSSIMSISIFVLSLRFKSTKTTVLSHIGRDYSMTIYIAHPIIGGIIKIFLKDNAGNIMVTLLLPIAVIVASLVVAIIVENIIKRFCLLNRKAE